MRFKSQRLDFQSEGAAVTTERDAEIRRLRAQGWAWPRIAAQFGLSRRRVRNIGCTHHWLIEEPDGPTAMGVCKRCGAKREHLNTIPVKVWMSQWHRPQKKKA